MGLLHDIQASVVQEGANLGSVLLKLRLLAARLGSEPLQEWIKHESEGYPQGAEVPSYRIVDVIYTGTFAGPLGSGLNNVQIPGYLIEKFAGQQWTKHKVRDGIAAIDELVNAEGHLWVDASNLILKLQGKIYPQYSLIDIRSEISIAAMKELQYAVRSRVLELTIGFEKSIPAAAYITFGPQETSNINTDKVNQIYQQTVFGNVTTISTTGSGAPIIISIQEGNMTAFMEYLIKAGLPKEDATELAGIVQSEKPVSKEEPLGAKASDWMKAKVQKAGAGLWKMGQEVATKIITEAVMQYYGIKE